MADESERIFDFIGQLGRESDRGKVLISTGYIESRLQDLLLAFMVDDKISISLFSGANAALGSFSSRIVASHALGLINHVEYSDLQLIRRIRNDFAHDVATSFRTREVVSRCAQLQSTTDKVSRYPQMAAQQFESAVVAIIFAFANRPRFVALRRLSYGQWGQSEQRRT